MKKFTASSSRLKDLLVLGPLAPELNEFFRSLPCLAIDGAKGVDTLQNEVIRIGDGDSGPAEQMDILLEQKKDASDLAIALEFIPSEAERIHMLGFKGGRTDHELANYAEIYRYQQLSNSKTFIFYNESRHEYAYFFSPGQYTIDIKDLFSLFTFEEGQLSIAGDCEYHWEGAFRPYSSLGLSNTGRGQVHLKSTTAFMLFNQGTVRL
ncbi:MAG: hypothetical protein JNM93_06350 [Bacteriovoracaceae bacterium]|nr:hypothetical protein [Bacteriovoracaceae bacterium]